MAQIWPSFLVFATLLLGCHHASSLVPKFDNATDQHALLAFKSMISDDSRGLLISWNNSIPFCEWAGVACGGRRHPHRVISLVLSSLGLAGSISQAITNLTFLRMLDLSNNQFHGPIPQEIGRLFRLQHLNLSMNSLEGEYGVANRVSTRGDVYSYGILLLEMFTAKSPTDDIFMEGLSLQKFVKIAFPQHITDVIDAQLLSVEDEEETDGAQSTNVAKAIDCIASVLQIGVICSNEIPVERLEMGEVVRELHKIRTVFLRN